MLSIFIYNSESHTHTTPPPPPLLATTPTPFSLVVQYWSDTSIVQPDTGMGSMIPRTKKLKLHYDEVHVRDDFLRRPHELVYSQVCSDMPQTGDWLLFRLHVLINWKSFQVACTHECLIHYLSNDLGVLKNNAVLSGMYILYHFVKAKCMLSLSEHGSTLDVKRPRAYCFPHEAGGWGRVGEEA